MEKLIQMLQEKAQLDEATAKRVAEVIKTHIGDIPVWLGSDGASKLFGEVSNFFGNLAGNEQKAPAPEPPPVQPKD